MGAAADKAVVAAAGEAAVMVCVHLVCSCDCVQLRESVREFFVCEC